mgnify:CR=1 FL=1
MTRTDPLVVFTPSGKRGRFDAGTSLLDAARKLGVDLRVGLPVLGKGVRRMLAIAVPGAIAGGALQVSSLVTQTLSGSDEGARSVLVRHRARLRLVPLPGHHATTDLDTPEDWAAWRAAQAKPA